jgi:hypothetical protein
VIDIQTLLHFSLAVPGLSSDRPGTLLTRPAARGRQHNDR